MLVKTPETELTFDYGYNFKEVYAGEFDYKFGRFGTYDGYQLWILDDHNWNKSLAYGIHKQDASRVEKEIRKALQEGKEEILFDDQWNVVA